MRLSVIIISYNVKYFLEQCLCSVQEAIRHLEAEIIVVDNQSSDGSMDYLRPLFPAVNFISNDSNRGFAYACNQGLQISRGEYLLFLNPDTLIPEDCLEKCIDFFRCHTDAGGLGVRMLDGQGKFLPESKRAFPSPMVSFCKLSGLSSIFPRSPFFNRYALGHLDSRKDHEVEVLAGAFLMAPRDLLQQLEGFDERFFLYGEDIDLSCRIRDQGLKNYYFSGTEIIHFKGESAAPARLDHTRFFYRAMTLFIEKHYARGAGRWFAFLLRIAVSLRSVIAFTGRLLQPILLPLFDICMVWMSLYLVKNAWIRFVRYQVDFHVPFIAYGLPLFSVCFVVTAGFAGLYDTWCRPSKTLLSVAMGVAGMLILYSLLPEDIRFSRGVMISGGLAAGSLLFLYRWAAPGQLFTWLGYERVSQGGVAVIGDLHEYREVSDLLYPDAAGNDLLGRIDPGGNRDEAIGCLQDIPVLQQNTRIGEMIFCAGTMPFSLVIRTLTGMKNRYTRFLFHFRGSRSLVGSDLPGRSGRYIGGLDQYRLADPWQQRMKRITDMVFALFLLISFPIHLLLHKKAGHLLKNAVDILLGRKTWVGYLHYGEGLPTLRRAVITHTVFPGTVTEDSLLRADAIYARNYDWWQDVQTVIKRYPDLG